MAMPLPLSDRSKDYSGKSSFKEDISDLYNDVEKAFEEKEDQIKSLERYWRIFNTELTENQAYAGNSQIYLPLIRDAIEARVTRFVNMLFPQAGQHVDVVAYGGEQPLQIMALLNHYVHRANLRLIAPALLRNGEVEGHYSIYLDWQTTERYITRKVEKPIEMDGVPDYESTYMDVEETKIEDSHPTVDVLPAADIAVYPVTACDLEIDAEFVAIRRRYSKGKIRQMNRDGVFTDDATKDLLAVWKGVMGSPDYNVDIEKKKIEAAGVKRKGDYCLVYEVWKRFKIDGRRRWCRLFLWGSGKPPLSFKVNPNWNDRCPLLSWPRTKISGSFWGKSPVDAVEQVQYAANDAANMAWDSAQYSLLPIVMTDPEKNPNMASMILGLASIWQTNPKDTQILSFPQLWRDALEITANAKSQVMQSFGLNPAMMPQGVANPKSRPNQAQVAQETAVAIETTANEVTTLESAGFSPMLHRFFEADQQFRKTSMQIKIYGQLGIEEKMMEIPTFAWDDRYEFRWKGVETFRSAQATQQMIAGMNILRSLPPVLSSGKRIELDPIIEVLVENTYGPRMANKILKDVRSELSVPPDVENGIMAGGMEMPVHQFDPDPEHLQSHTQYAQATGDPNGLIRQHIQLHVAQMQKKQQQPGQAGAPGSPGGSGPGVAGTPRPGAQPAANRGDGQNP